MSSPTNKTSMLMAIPILILLGILFFILNFLRSTDTSSTSGTSVSTEDGKQVIEIKAKGGYSPASVAALANKDTILRVKTDSTFDCSSALTIPKLGIRKNLPPTATTDIPLGPQSPGTKLAGTCAMGMYNFNLTFN